MSRLLNRRSNPRKDASRHRDVRHRVSGSNSATSGIQLGDDHLDRSFRGASLGLKATQPRDLIRQVERGLPWKALESLATRSGIGVNALGSVLGIPVRTLARRRAAGRLAPDESERLLRLARILEEAVELFEGDAQRAVTWLTSPKKALGNESPLGYSRTEVGAREVENLIGRLEQGVFS